MLRLPAGIMECKSALQETLENPEHANAEEMQVIQAAMDLLRQRVRPSSCIPYSPLDFIPHHPSFFFLHVVFPSSVLSFLFSSGGQGIAKASSKSGRTANEGLVTMLLENEAEDG